MGEKVMPRARDGRTKEVVELRQAASIALALRQDVDAVLQVIPPSKRGSRLEKVLDQMVERMEAIEQCVRDADASSLPAAKLTKAQASVLFEVQRVNDGGGGSAHIARLRTNRGVMDRLREAGLIHSEQPFAYTYHSVTITAAGRAALEATK